MLTKTEEKILKTIEDLGPDYVYNQLFGDDKSQAALTSLIYKKLITPDFMAKDEMVDQYLKGQTINRDDFDLHFRLTEKGYEYAQEIYIPNPLFSSRLVTITALVALVAMVGLSLWGLF